MSEKSYVEEAKELSLGYFVTGGLVLAIAVLLGLLTRISQTGWLGNVPRVYYSLMTLHGMAAFVGWGCFTAMGLTWYVLVRTLDSPLHSPKLVKLIYWLFAVAFVLLAVSVLYGGFGGSWVFLYPIAFYGYWNSTAASIWTIGVILAGVGIILYGVEILLTIRKAGYSLLAALGFESFRKDFDQIKNRIPLAAVPFAVIGLGMIIATIPFAYLLVYQLLELIGIIDTRMDPLLAKNFLWWFGHPVVYLILFPVVGFFYYVTEIYAGQKLVGERYAKLAWALATIVQNFIGAHHLYADIAQQPWIHVWSQLGTYAIIIPSLISIFSITATIYISEFKWGIASQYMFVSLTFWLLAGLSGWVNATISLNINIHNTLWVVAHFHVMALLALTTMIFGMGYQLISDYTEGEFNEKLGIKALWTYVIGALGFTHFWFIQGLWGGIRRSFASTPESLTMLTYMSIPFMIIAVIGVWLNIYVAFKAVFGPSTKSTAAAPVAGS